jgi:hypothetical protein
MKTELTDAEIDALPLYASQSMWCHVLLCSRATLGKWYQQGRLNGYKDNQLVIHTKEDILEALNISPTKTKAKAKK